MFHHFHCICCKSTVNNSLKRDLEKLDYIQVTSIRQDTDAWKKFFFFYKNFHLTCITREKFEVVRSEPFSSSASSKDACPPPCHPRCLPLPHSQPHDAASWPLSDAFCAPSSPSRVTRIRLPPSNGKCASSCMIRSREGKKHMRMCYPV